MTVNGASTSMAFGTYKLFNTGVLTLDDSSVGNVNNRLGGSAKIVTMQGGTLNLLGNASGTSSESIATLTVSAGGASVINLSGSATLTATTLDGPGQANTGTLLVNFGTGGGTLNATFGNTTTLVGNTTWAGTANRAIVPYIFVNGPNGTDFATWNVAGTMLVPLTSLASTNYDSNTIDTNNDVISTAVTAPATAQTPNSITLRTGGSIALLPYATLQVAATPPAQLPAPRAESSSTARARRRSAAVRPRPSARPTRPTAGIPPGTCPAAPWP